VIQSVTNILLKSLFKIKNHDPIVGQPPSAMTHYFSSYRVMQDLSIVSFKKNLQGDWQLIELGGEFSRLSYALRYVMAQTKKIWKTHYPCNILYTDPDTLCIKPLDLFGKFFEFRLFTDGHPLSRKQYHNCGVRYFPKELTDAFWESIDSKMSQWDHKKYDYEQETYIDCLWEQPSLYKQLSQPQSHVVKQITHKGHDAYNNYYSDAAILHVHASRGPTDQLTCMQEYWAWINSNQAITEKYNDTRTQRNFKT